VNIDVAYWNPFHTDVVEASIWLDAPVALEQTILPLIVSASFNRFSSVAHYLVRLMFLHPWSYCGPRFTRRLLDKSRTGYQ